MFFKKNLVINVVQTFKRNLEESLDEALEDSIYISTTFLEMENSYSSMKSLQYDILVDVALGVKWIYEVGFKNLKVVGLQLGDVAILDISTARQDELTTQSIRSDESRFQFDPGDYDEALPAFLNSIAENFAKTPTEILHGQGFS